MTETYTLPVDGGYFGFAVEKPRPKLEQVLAEILTPRALARFVREVADRGDDDLGPIEIRYTVFAFLQRELPMRWLSIGWDDTDARLVVTNPDHTYGETYPLARWLVPLIIDDAKYTLGEIADKFDTVYG